MEENQDVMVRNLTFVETLSGRAVHHILPALAKIYAKLEKLGPSVVSHSLRSSQRIDLSTGASVDAGSWHHYDFDLWWQLQVQWSC